jgi:hypothetical protein
MGHVSHHKRRSASRTAARIMLILAAVTFSAAIGHFSYTAYESSQCYTANTSDPFSTEPLPQTPIDSDSCRAIIAGGDEHQRTDAAIAILAAVLLIGAGVRLSKASHRTRRLVLVAEIIVVTIGALYTILLASALR